MFDYIEQHKRLVLGIAIGIILIMLGFLFYLSRSQTTTNTNIPPDTNNESNYQFLQQNISADDKYLMLNGKIITEEYGTYTESNITSLLDVQNQSTADFKTKVQTLIDSIPSGKDITTVVDPNSVQITHNGDLAIVTMDASVTDGGKKQTNTSSVSFVKQGAYWLVTDISSTSK